MINSFLNSIWNKLLIKRHGVQTGHNLTVNGRLAIYGSGTITIGDNVIINSSPDSNPTGINRNTCLYSGCEGKIVIGNGSGLSNCVITAFHSVTVGDDVMIGTDCKIYDTDFHSSDFKERMTNDRRFIPMKPVVIDDGAFVGTGSIILKGVRIGKKSVVGAGSVVTKSIPDGEIWAGNPARFVRKICG